MRGPAELMGMCPLGAEAELATRRYAASPAAVAAQRTASVVVVVPTVDEAATIAPICEALVKLRRGGAIDRVVVMDDSSDATPFLAEAAGAEVVRQRQVRADCGPLLGKGDAMWRALDVCDEDVIAFVDGDTEDFRAEMACDLIAAVAIDGFSFVKGTYRRPFATGGAVLPTGGGRVTELTAKPLLGALLPELRGFDQPLAGEIVARGELLRALPFAMGYSVDVALLIDAWRHVGLPAMAQVDTGVRQNRHRPLHQLAPMAEAVMAAILDRAGLVSAGGEGLVERPPMAWSLGLGAAEAA